LPDAVMDRLRRDAPVRPAAIADVTATVVDLVGGLDAADLRDRAAALAGTSLLRDPPARREVLLWNCPPTRECAAEAFGTLSFPLKLHYVGHDHRYACHDLLADPAEREPLPLARCSALFPVLDSTFGARPGGLAPGRGGD